MRQTFNIYTLEITGRPILALSAKNWAGAQRVKRPLGMVSHRYMSPIKGGARCTVPI